MIFEIRPPLPKNLIRNPICFYLKIYYIYTWTICWYFFQLSLERFLNNAIFCYFACIKIAIFTFSKRHIFFSPQCLKLFFLYIMSTSKFFFLKWDMYLRSETLRVYGQWYAVFRSIAKARSTWLWHGIFQKVVRNSHCSAASNGSEKFR